MIFLQLPFKKKGIFWRFQFKNQFTQPLCRSKQFLNSTEGKKPNFTLGAEYWEKTSISWVLNENNHDNIVIIEKIQRTNMPIENLPNHIFFLIRDFVFDPTSFDYSVNRPSLVLNYSDPSSWRNFVNTNKGKFFEIKRLTAYYNLNDQRSREVLQLATNTSIFSAIQRAKSTSTLAIERLKVLSLQDVGKQFEFSLTSNLQILPDTLKNIHFPIENLTLNLQLNSGVNLFGGFTGGAEPNEISFVNLPSLKNLRILRENGDRTKTITLIFPTSMRLESFYCEIPCIFSDLSAMKCFLSARMVKMPLKDPSMDISALGGVARLDLSYSSIKDVSSLRHVHTLNLQGCSEVVDVSMLGEVYDLNISECPRILSINGLGKVKKLSVKGLTSLQDGLPLDAEAREVITDPITYQLAGISELNDHKKRVGIRAPARNLNPFGGPSTDLIQHFKIPFTHVSVLNHDLRNYSDLTGIEDLVLTRSILPPDFPTAFFPQLKRLLLLECEGIDRLVFDLMPNLKVLKIDRCVDLKNVTVEHEMDELVLFADAKIVNLTIRAPLKLLNVNRTTALEMIDVRAPVSRFEIAGMIKSAVNMNY